ncbi:MAG: EAL domain-containing protein [Lachnospiraceae bacterium]|nr:EAL domain-containing protein [Lachnospiraceae bacterium]
MAIQRAGILIISQSNIGAEALKALLEVDYHVFIAPDITGATSVLEAQVIDFIMIDITERTDELLDFTANIKHSKEYKHILIGVIHDHMDSSLSERCYRLGISYTICRPLDPRVVKNIVDNLVYTYIDERNEREEKRIEYAHRAHTVLGTLRAGLVVIAGDHNLSIRHISRNSLKILGYDAESEPEAREALIDSSFADFIHPEDRDNFYNALTGVIPDMEEAISIIVRLRLKNEQYAIFEINVREMVYVLGEQQFSLVLRLARTGLTGTDELKTEISRYEQKLRIDPLTGIYNRDTFFAETERMIKENPDQEYVIGIWDIDRFKAINALFGVKAGDQVLKDYAVFLKSVFEYEKGTYGRLEADRFISCGRARYLQMADKRLQPVLDGTVKWHSLDYTVQMHAGIYRLQSGEADIAAACDRAMMALNAVKGNYLYRINYFTREMLDAMLIQQQIIRDSERAHLNGEFFVVYQPIVDSRTKEIVSAEALMRWKKPDGTLVPPGVFVPIFEKNGFVSKIDMYVWEAVCAYQKRRIGEGKKTVPISVNLSRVDFYNENLFEDLMAVTQEYGVDGRHLKVEVTESVYMDQQQELMNITKKLRNEGFEVLMDDFGSGFSSLSMLKDFEIDVLKIDMKFMDAVDFSERAGNILYSIIQMAKTIRMRIVAEGVETANQYELLKNMECDCIQGYYFYKPLMEQEFDRELDAGRKETVTDSAAEYKKILYIGTNSEDIRFIESLLDAEVEIVPAATCKDAENDLEKNFGKVNLVLIDFDSAEEEGTAFLAVRKTREYYGLIPIVLIAGESIIDRISHYIWEGVLDIVTRPLNRDTMKNRLERAVNYFNIEKERRSIKLIGKSVALKQQINSFFEDSIAGIARIVVDRSEDMNIMELTYVNDRFLSIHGMTLDEAMRKDRLGTLLSRVAFSEIDAIDRQIYTATQNRESFLLREYCVEKHDGRTTSILSASSFKYIADVIRIDMILLENDSMVERRMLDLINVLSRHISEEDSFSIWRYYIDEDIIDHYLEKEKGHYIRILDHDASKNTLAIAKVDPDRASLREVHRIYEDLRQGMTHVTRDIHIFGADMERFRLDEKGEKAKKEEDRWDRISYYVMNPEARKGRYAIGIRENVTKEYALEHKMWREQQYGKLVENGAIIYLEADIIDNVLLIKDIVHRLHAYGVRDDASYDDVLHSLSRNIDETDRDKVMSTLSRRELVRLYRSGKTLINFEFMGKTMTEPEWLRYEGLVVMGENRKTGHVEIGLRLAKSYKNESARIISEYDSLTGLYNRTMFEKTINQILLDRGKAEPHAEATFILIDVDSFRRVNNVFGHNVGDSILKTVAKIISSEFEQGAVIGRLSGDEFVVFLAEVTDRDEMVEKIRAVNEKTYYELDAAGRADENVVVATSIGVVYTQDTQERFHTLYPKANLAVRNAKEAGRNTWRVYDNPL